MISITDEIINEIAEELQLGLNCYYNKKTGELLTIMNHDALEMNGGDEFYRDDIRELEENSDDYIDFENMDSRDSFRVMAGFAESINEKNLQRSLRNALEKAKPFRHFNDVIDNSGKFRQKWFDYQNECYIERVKNRLKRYNSSQENE